MFKRVVDLFHAERTQFFARHKPVHTHASCGMRHVSVNHSTSSAARKRGKRVNYAKSGGEGRKGRGTTKKTRQPGALPDNVVEVVEDGDVSEAQATEQRVRSLDRCVRRQCVRVHIHVWPS